MWINSELLMKKLTLKQIINKIKKIKFERFDLIVAIGNDGIMPASLLRYFLKLPVYVIWINYRDNDNKAIRKEPRLMKPLTAGLKKLKNNKILLVDTVSRTGKTLEKAKELLKGNRVKTFVVNGGADYSLFNFKECILWPWS